jgi:type IV pilus assembly protein PilY1
VGTGWRTVLVGGLGKGGKAYYALDITDPNSVNINTGQSTAESTVATRVLWEFTHSDLGYTYGEATAVKTKKYGWVLIFGSGYNNTDGKGYFFIVNPRTGELIQKIGTGEGAPTAQAGLAHVQAYVLDRTDNTADSVYAGDLLGNLWRLDLRDANGVYPAPVKLARLTDSSNNPRPVTTRPTLIVQPGSLKRWVTVGTGRLLDASDVASTQPQAMYAIQDGNALSFNVTAPTGFTFPITTTQLLQLTDLTKVATLNTNTQIGWYVDLGLTAGQGWRVISDPSSFYGSVEFTTTLPGGDACSPSGTSRVYSIDLGTGQSDLVADDGTTVIAYNAAMEGMATEQRSYGIDDNGKIRRMLVVGDTKGKTKGVKTKQLTAPGLRRLNWRELPLAN